jgi:hypothetical protein
MGKPALWGPNVEEFRKGVHFSCPTEQDSSNVINNTNKRVFDRFSAIFMSGI